MAFIAGTYTATLNGNTLGVTEGGFEIENINFGERIIGDNLGQSMQDYVYQGGDVFISMVLEEYNAAGAAAAFWPWAVWGTIGQVGRLATAVGTALVLTDVAGTAAAGLPASISVTKAILAPGFSVRQLLATRLRKIPLRLQALPQGSAGSETWFALT